MVLVLGAGDRAARAAALRLAAHGAAIVAAGPDLGDVVVTAGMVAAAGGVSRVIEGKAPPLEGAELLLEAAATLEPPTDALVAESAFASSAAAWEAAHYLGVQMQKGARVAILPRIPAGQESAAGEKIAARFVGAPPAVLDDISSANLPAQPSP